MSFGFKIPAGVEACKFEDCFFMPPTWDDASKLAYTKWLARMSDDHPSRSDPEPWRRDHEQE